MGSLTFPREDVPRQFFGNRGASGHVGGHGAGHGRHRHGRDVHALQEGRRLCHENMGPVLAGHQR